MQAHQSLLLTAAGKRHNPVNYKEDDADERSRPGILRRRHNTTHPWLMNLKEKTDTGTATG